MSGLLVGVDATHRSATDAANFLNATSELFGLLGDTMDCEADTSPQLLHHSAAKSRSPETPGAGEVSEAVGENGIGQPVPGDIDIADHIETDGPVPVTHPSHRDVDRAKTDGPAPDTHPSYPDVDHAKTDGPAPDTYSSHPDIYDHTETDGPIPDTQSSHPVLQATCCPAVWTWLFDQCAAQLSDDQVVQVLEVAAAIAEHKAEQRTAVADFFCRMLGTHFMQPVVGRLSDWLVDRLQPPVDQESPNKVVQNAGAANIPVAMTEGTAPSTVFDQDVVLDCPCSEEIEANRGCSATIGHPLSAESAETKDLTSMMDVTSYKPFLAQKQRSNRCMPPMKGRPRHGVSSSKAASSLCWTGLSSDLLLLMNFVRHVASILPTHVRQVVSVCRPLVQAAGHPVASLLFDVLQHLRGENGNEEVRWLAWQALPLVPASSEILPATSEGGLKDAWAQQPLLRQVCVQGGYPSVEVYLDTYFRLLREDCFAQLRDGVHRLLAGTLDARDMHTYTNVQLAGMTTSQNGTEWAQPRSARKARASSAQLEALAAPDARKPALHIGRRHLPATSLGHRVETRPKTPGAKRSGRGAAVQSAAARRAAVKPSRSSTARSA